MLAEVWDADAPPVEDTLFALKRLAGQLTNAVDVLGGRLTDDLDGATPIVWGKVLRELRQLLIGIEQLGLEAKLVELQAEQAQLVSSAFRAAIAVVGSALLPQHRDAMLRTFLKGIGVDVVRLEAAAPEPAGQVVSGELGE